MIVLASCTALYAQGDPDEAKLGIVNGRAITLPKPEYPQELKDLCAEGKVEIDVSIDERGKGTKARAISGDHLLYPVALQAARNATFQKMPSYAIKSRGIVVYNFINDVRCFDAGVVNKNARVLPKPVFRRTKFSQPQTIKIRVIIDPESGNVILARAEGNRTIDREAESAARGAKFYPTNDVGKIRLKGFIIYTVSKNGRVTT